MATCDPKTLLASVSAFRGASERQIRLARIGSLCNVVFPPVAAPTAPSNLTATPNNTVPNVALGWTQGAGTITSVKLYRQVNGGGFSLYQTLGVVTAYTDTGVAYGNTYDYKVLDHGPGGDSAFSNSATAVVAIDPTTFATPASWYDASSLVGFANTDPVGAAAKEFVDRMGVSNHYGRQTTAGFRPVYRTNIFGTKPSVFFDEKDDLSVQQFLDLSNGLVGNAVATAGDWTIICVYKAEANVAGSQGGIVLGGNAYANGTLIGIQGTTNNIGVLSMRSDGATGIQSAALASGFDTAMMGVWQVSATNFKFRENKTDRTSGGSGFGTLTFSHMGAAAAGTPVPRLRGHVGELVIYLIALTTVQLDSLYDNYFKPKWSLP